MEDYLEAAHTEAGKLMSKYPRLFLLQPRSHTNLTKLSAEGWTWGTEIGMHICYFQTISPTAR